MPNSKKNLPRLSDTRRTSILTDRVHRSAWAAGLIVAAAGPSFSAAGVALASQALDVGVAAPEASAARAVRLQFGAGLDVNGLVPTPVDIAEGDVTSPLQPEPAIHVKLRTRYPSASWVLHACLLAGKPARILVLVIPPTYVLGV